MKTTTLLMACGILLAGTALFAQDSNRADLLKTAGAPEVQKELSQPDGAAIFMKPDGSFQILARGTGTYDFDDVDDINDARKEGVLKAKAALAKFMKEKLSSEEGFAQASAKLKSITTDGVTQKANVSKKTVKTSGTFIQNSAKELLRGVITLKEQKVPYKGTSGEIQVTVGVSSKTLKAAAKLNQAIKSNSTDSSSSQPAGSSNNKAETRSAVSDF